MEFKISKREFLNALNLSAKAISPNTPLPALSGIKLICDTDSLVLISSDSNISIKTSIVNKEGENTLTVVSEGEVVIDSKYILEIVRKIDSDFINFEVIDGTFTKIYGGNSEFKINGMRATDYPDINFEIDETNGFEISTESLTEIVSQTAFACSDKETRPVLTGVNFKVEDHKLHINATDSYRLASKVVDLDSDITFNITIPAKYLNDVIHSLSNEKMIKLVITSQKISFLFSNSIIQTRLLDDIFPDVNKLVPTSFSQKLVVFSNDLYNAIDRSSFIKYDGKNVVKITITKEKVDISSSNQLGSSYENIDVLSFEGDPLEISCSGKYLLDAIKALKSEKTTICLSGELKPMVLKNEEDESLIQLVSPVRTYR